MPVKDRPAPLRIRSRRAKTRFDNPITESAVPEPEIEPYWPRDSWNGVLALVGVAGTALQVVVFLAVMFRL